MLELFNLFKITNECSQEFKNCSAFSYQTINVVIIPILCIYYTYIIYILYLY